MYGYRVLKDFIGIIKGKTAEIKAGQIIPYAEAITWRNLENLISCRYLSQIEIDSKSIQKTEGVF